MFERMQTKLQNLISGRETSTEYVKRTFIRGTRPTDFCMFTAPVQTADGPCDFRFAIQDDCSCAAINDFLKVATAENLTFAEGPRGGKVLGVDNSCVPGFYAYHRP